MDWTSLLELLEIATLALCLLCVLGLWQTTKGE
jgi:hypothetical protein